MEQLNKDLFYILRYRDYVYRIIPNFTRKLQVYTFYELFKTRVHTN